jgi:hypothetical protein
MAKEKKPRDPNKTPGIFAQFKDGVEFLRKEDPKAVPLAIVVGILTAVGITVIGSLVSSFAYLAILLWLVLGVVTGYLAALLVISRKANTAVYVKFANEPGRVSIAVGSLTRRTYKGTNQPVAINPRTKDMIFRVVGPAGVVLMGEGSPTSTKSMLDEERRKIQRAVNGVTVHTLYCSQGAGGVPLRQLEKDVRKMKRTMNRAEINAVQNRLSALDTRSMLPIPKGIDPMKIRPSKRMR